MRFVVNRQGFAKTINAKGRSPPKENRALVLRPLTPGHNTNNQATSNPRRVDQCPFVCRGMIRIHPELYKS
jgi:hypothetical protein